MPAIKFQIIVGCVWCFLNNTTFAQGPSSYVDFFILEKTFAKAEVAQRGGRHMNLLELRDIILKQSPKEIWMAAEQGGFFAEGFPSYSVFGAASGLFEVLAGQGKFAGHIKKSEFVEPMLEKVLKLQVPTGEKRNWNEAAIVDRGGIAGILIEALPKLCRKEDCAKIVDAISATKDSAKMDWLKESVKNSPFEEEFTNLLNKPPVETGAMPSPIPPTSEAGPTTTAALGPAQEKLPGVGGAPPRAPIKRRQHHCLGSVPEPSKHSRV